MRSFRLALALFVVGAAACSVVLDTDALQQGTGGTAGAGGSGGSTDAGGAGGSGGTSDSGFPPGAPCESDLDCQPVDAVNGCFHYECKDKLCQAPRYSGGGIAITSVPNVETADQADDIGTPVLLADGTDLVLAAWKRNGTTTNIVIRKYDERIEVSPTAAELNAITMSRFESVSSSPGLIIRGIPRKLRMFAAAKPTGVASTGMYQLDVDLSNLRMSATQPTKVDVGVVGYDTNAHGPAPRLLPAPALGEPVGIWIQQGKLFFFDANNSGEVFGTKRVIGFAPLAATGGLHAALETTELGANDDQGQTELWTRGSPSLTALINDQPGARRRGVAATATGAESSGPLNFVAWSFERGTTPSLFYAGAGCDANQCTAVGSPAGTNPALPATNPAIASARVGTSMERDLAATFQISGPDPNRPGTINTALIGGITRLGPNADGGSNLTARAMNPPSFVVTLQNNQMPVTLGPSAVAMTSGGLMMVAWVEQSQNRALLKTRRFQIKPCPLALDAGGREPVSHHDPRH